MRQMSRSMRGWLCVVVTLAAVLTACASSSRAPTDRPQASATARGGPAVTDQSVSVREPDSAVRVVVHGDTLYSIAWETGRDYRELAKWNRIAPPYTIKPGQALRVKPPASEPAAQPEKPTTVTSAGTRKTATAKSPASRGTHPTAANAASVSAPGKSSAKTKSATKSTVGAPAVPAAATVTPSAVKPTTGKKLRASTAAPASVGSRGWSWPADGQVLNRYTESDSKGVDIAGARSAPVRAAADGRVVYQGSGLRGYGQLIIIKHNDEFLSAYAHNDRIYVKEGDAVKRGQKIADMGSTGTDRVKLHFEIRRQGVPVDPLKYLPSR